MIAFRLWGALASASVLVLSGCGGSSGSGSGGGGAAVPVAQKALSSDAANAAGASASPLPVAVSREQAVIEQKISTGSNADRSPFRPKSSNGSPPPAQVRLEALPAEAQGIQKSASAGAGNAEGLDVPVRIGLSRKVPDAAQVQQVSAMLGWSPSSNGDAMLSAVRFVSAGAKGVRVGVKVESLPLVAMVRFYADGADTVYEVSSQEILSTIQRNVDAGDTSDAARTYWSPNMGGEAITMEVEIPKGSSVDAVRISVPALSHVLVDIRKLDSITKVGEADTCTKDVSCTSTYNEVSKSVALMDFVVPDDGKNYGVSPGNYVCTGTLLNDRLSSGIPYFLSANHCISNQTVASSLYTLWFYRSASCNSTQISPSLAAMTSGATLLYASADTDTSFMRLNTAPPAGVVYAGTSPFAMDYYDSVYGVSHPKGDLQKYTFGNYLGTGSCTSGNCAPSSASTAGFLRVSWLQGMTQSGSSGSGLFTKMNGKDYLVGQLLGGYASCSNPMGNEYYGRFDKAYSAALYQWLGATSSTFRQPVYRLYNRRTATHFYTTSPAERDRAVEKLGAFNYEGVAFYAYGAPGVANDTVYRFYNTRTGVHFYTINPSERDNVIRTLPWFTFEGASWYAGAGPISQASPMFRFYNTATGTHFYTINAAERDTILRTMPGFNFEGVAYYAWLSQ